MTPYQMVKEECANCKPDGSCFGVSINQDLSLGLFDGDSRLCSVRKMHRCPYFEDIVLPMADMFKDPSKAKAFNEARQIYIRRALKKEGIETNNVLQFIQTKTGLCPDCEERPRMFGGTRCPVCAKKHAKELSRQLKDGQRAQDGELLP